MASFGVLLLPLTTTALSFFFAITGTCLTLTLHYMAIGRFLSLPGLFAFGLALGSMGIYVVMPFVLLPMS